MGQSPIPHHFMAGQRGAGGVRIPGIRVRKVKGYGQTWGKAPYPITGHGKVRKGSFAWRAHSVRACAGWQRDCRRRVQSWQAHCPGVRVRKVKGYGQTWGKAPYPLTGNEKMQKGSFARRTGSVRACAGWQNDCRRRVQPRQILRSHHSGAESGVHILCEHVLTGKRTVGGVCRTGRLHYPTIRV